MTIEKVDRIRRHSLEALFLADGLVRQQLTDRCTFNNGIHASPMAFPSLGGRLVVPLIP